MAGPPDDYNNEPTRYRDVGRGNYPPAGEPPSAPDQPDPVEPQLDPFDETEPTPWYRKPAGLIIWGLSVLILIALIVYGIIELIGDRGTGNAPSTHTTTTTTSPTTTSATTTPTTTTEPTTTTATTEPPTTSTAVAPAPQPTRQEPTRRRHWPSWLPSTMPAIP
ncbi:hypothetical protein SKC41_04645 [Mycobacterium sp. 050128]